MRIVEIASRDLLASHLKGRSSAVHFKGFGPSMVPPSLGSPAEELVSELLAADVVVFDGDDDDDESFTYGIKASFDAAQQRGAGASRRFPMLLAFKYGSDADDFRRSWSRWSPGADRGTGEEPVMHCVLVDDAVRRPAAAEGEAAERDAAEGDAAEGEAADGEAADGEERRWSGWLDAGAGAEHAAHVIAARRALAECVRTELSARGAEYVRLGAYALRATAEAGLARTVVAWGGWNVVASEYAASVAAHGDALPWRYYHAVRSPPRRAAAGGGVNGDADDVDARPRQEGRLLGMQGLPALTIVQGRDSRFDRSTHTT